MLRSSLVVVVLALGRRATAQEPPPVTVPKLAASAKTLEAFVPAGWSLEHRLEQDFTGDGRSDAVLVLRMQSKANVLGQLDTNPRLLASVAGTATGFRLVFQNGALIPRHESANVEDPFERVEATPAGFVLSLKTFATMGSWWASSRTLRFRHERGCFRLIGFDDTSFHRASGESTSLSVNYLTGRSETARQESAEATPVKSRATVSRTPVCAEQLGDGLALDGSNPGASSP